MPPLPSRTITAANAVITLTIPGVFVTPQTLAQFATDDIYESDEVEITEIAMGVDGVMSQGAVYNPVPQRYMFQANSPSLDIFDNWFLAMRTLGDAISAFGQVTLQATGKKYIMNNGALRGYKVLPDAKKTLQPRVVRITWQEVLPAQI